MTVNAVGYARISNEDQSVTSLEDQPILIREYCERNGLQLAHIYVENGKSAFTFDRPQWQKLEARIRSDKNIRYIVVKHIDRFSRADLVDALIKIREIEGKLGVKILSVKDDVNQDSSDLGFKLLRTIELLMSNNERNRIRERTNDGIYRTLANGRWPSMAPYGYKNARDINDKPVLVIDPLQAEKVRKVFELFNSGVNAFEIARRVGLKKHRSFITEMLQRSLYAGIIEVPERKGKPAYETNSVNPPIISKQLFYQVQNKLIRKGNKFHGNEDVWLRGLLRCHECGKLMTAGKSKGTGGYYWYYKCGVHRKNISATKVHAVYMKILQECALPEDSIQRIKQSLLHHFGDKRKNKGGEIMTAKLELEKVRKKITQIQERFLLMPDVNPALYQKAINEYKELESTLENKLSVLMNDDSDILEKIEPVLQQLSDLPAIFRQWSFERKQRFVEVQLSAEVSFSGQLFYAGYAHPLFADKIHTLTDLIIIKKQTKTGTYPVGLLSTGQPAAGQLLDFLFMAV